MRTKIIYSAFAILAMGAIASVPFASVSTRTPVTITATYDFSTFPM
jgi:hypothetical protein